MTMLTNDAIRAMLSSAGVSTRAVSIRMGAYETELSSSLYKNSDFLAGKLSRIADACGYRLCLVPFADVPEPAIVIDGSRADDMIG